MSVNVYKNGELIRLAGDIELGTAAYTDSSEYDASGAADSALSEAKAYTNEEISKIDISGISENANAINNHETRISNIENDIATDEEIAIIFAD